MLRVARVHDVLPGDGVSAAEPMDTGASCKIFGKAGLHFWERRRSRCPRHLAARYHLRRGVGSGDGLYPSPVNLESLGDFPKLPSWVRCGAPEAYGVSTFRPLECA